MFENISASYDVGIAKKYGINCAVLLNKLIYLSRYTSRNDGYCWRTSKELEDELGLTRHQQDVAIKKLIDENLIETKNTYIIGTQIKCKHFKLLFDIDKCDLHKSDKSIDFNKSDTSDLYKNGKSVNNNNTTNNNTSNNIKEKSIKRKFDKPTIEQIQEYCIERNNGINAEAFYDFYESKNWYVGKNKMSDWKACVRTWEQRQQSKTKTSTDRMNEVFERFLKEDD